MLSRLLHKNCLAASILTALAVGPGLTLAQTPPPPNPHRTVNLNYVYAADLGFGGYALSGLSADVYTLPLDYTLHDTPRDGWGLKLMVPIQGGLYHFRATDTDGKRIAIDQQSIAIVPGLELQIPLGNRVMLKPFGQFGGAHSFNDSSNPDVWVYLAGVRALTQWQVGDYTVSLGNAVIYAGDSSIGPGFSERYISLQVGGEIRWPLGFKVGDVAPDVGIYLADDYYPSPLAFSRFLKPLLRVANQGEIGFSVGSATPFQMLWLSNPRIGVGFVFGGGLDVWHINFGFQF